MKLCKRCRGSGTLLRPGEGRSLRKSFKTCTDCGGHGTKPAPNTPARIGTGPFHIDDDITQVQPE